MIKANIGGELILKDAVFKKSLSLYILCEVKFESASLDGFCMIEKIIKYWNDDKSVVREYE